MISFTIIIIHLLSFVVQLIQLLSLLDFFVFFPMHFKTGFILFYLYFSVFIQNPPLELVRSIETFVKVVPSPVIVRLTEGAQSRVTRGWGQGLILDPGQNSIDPDDETNKVLY